MATLPEIEEQLKWKSKAVDLMLAIDRIRDTASEERELTAGVVSVLAEAVEAELCLLCLRDDDSGELQLRAVLDRSAAFDPDAEPRLRQLAERALTLADVTLLDAGLLQKNRRYPYCLAAPLRIGAENLGALVLLNADRPFVGEERTLVEAAVSQIDSALQHMRTLRDLRRRQKELEVIYRIDRIRDRQEDFDVMLTAVLAEVCRYIDAEAGFLMLYDQSGRELELRATTDRDLFGDAAAARLIRSGAETAIRQAQPIDQSWPGGAVRSLSGVPLILHGKLIGVLGVVNRKGRPAFTPTDRQMLRAIGSQMDTAIFESLQTQRLRSVFGQCVGPQVMERLLSISDRDLLGGERQVVTTLFSDIRGFTAMSGVLQPEILQAVLNDHLSAMTDLVLAYDGTLDKYIGDCVMCLFNAPERQPDHALRAVRLALEMQKAHREVMARWEGRVALPPIGIGISTGEAIVGNFGSMRRLEYTAIGADVNLASRLCGAAAGDQTLLSQSTYAIVQHAVIAEKCAPRHLKGIGDEVVCWELQGLR